MSQPLKILLWSFVRPFYRENTGAFIFVFIMMFYIVGQVDGAGLLLYHYTLIMGMLTSKATLSLVFFLWFLYSRKYMVFGMKVLKDPRFSFIHIYNCIGRSVRFRLLLIAEILFLLPILLYSIAIITIGVYHHFYVATILTVVYLALLCIVPAWWHSYRMDNPDHELRFAWRMAKGWPKSYPFILVRLIARKQKMFWLGIKIFTCGILYLIARNNTLTPSDISTVFLFYDFGILGNGIVLYSIRELEETQLRFYRGMPVSLGRRFFQYAMICLILIAPEYITAAMLAPQHLSYTVAVNFSLCGYSVMLLMYAITFLQDFNMRDYLKIVLLVFSMQYILVVTGAYIILYSFFFILAFVLFVIAYYRYERSM